MATVTSVNIGQITDFEHNCQTKQTAINKFPVEGPVKITRLGLDGDEQESSNHGGIDQAVYTYSVQDYAWWSEQLKQDLLPGTFAENITLDGVDLRDVVCGERWMFGTALLEATQPRLPCWKFQSRMGMEGWVERFNEGGRMGAYFRVTEEGEVATGDQATLVSKPKESMTMHELFRIKAYETDRAAEILKLEALSPKWKEWAEKATAGTN